jgi:transcriptional regulator with XRE-family HTH domain
MTQVNNDKFGEFILELRKEKGLTQKELAEKLYISDKAVSKWERGLSMPDISLLIPLSQIFGVTTTELLSGKRIEKDKGLTISEVETLMNQTIHLSKEEVVEQNKNKKNRKTIFFSGLIIVILELFFMNLSGYTKDDFFLKILTVELLMLIFGVYLTFFAKETLPTYYDENKISFYSDGFFRINMAGLHFNNSNWKHVLRTIHLAVISIFTIFPLLYFGISWFNLTLGVTGQLILNLVPIFGLLIPVYFVGKKYE